MNQDWSDLLKELAEQEQEQNEIDFGDAILQHLHWQCPICGYQLSFLSYEEVPSRCPVCGS